MARGPSSTTPSTRGSAQVEVRQDRRRTSTPTWRSSTSGTGTTSTRDGNFNEADGYIDHFQAVHAGEGEEAGDSTFHDAIWSHRWYVNPAAAGSTVRPSAASPTSTAAPASATRTNFIGDYTVEPENGGLGVFAHEYGHDLGLPDFYDTNGGDNGTSFWTTMSSGSWLGHGGADEGIGTQPGIFGPEEKLFLGWLEVRRGQQGRQRRHQYTLTPSQSQTTAALPGPSRST